MQKKNLKKISDFCFEIFRNNFQNFKKHAIFQNSKIFKSKILEISIFSKISKCDFSKKFWFFPTYKYFALPKKYYTYTIFAQESKNHA